MDRAKASPSTMTDAELVNLIVEHKTKMNGNPNFPTPKPTAVEFDAKTGPYLTADALVTSLEGQLKVAIKSRNDARPAAEGAIVERRDYVQTASGGSAPIILTSGFAVAGKRGPAAPPVPPAKLGATMGDHSGCVDTMWHGQHGRSFIIQICSDPMSDAGWRQLGFTTNSSFTAKGLTSGTKYWFRVCSLLGDVQSEWCGAIECMAA
ncbi:MAG: fibronectin type III domain-containing protein [Verrucomicrobia bacterium]|nr:fibronectin type III domain-containing protein [Verrucomicrobiota bacterium]